MMLHHHWQLLLDNHQGSNVLRDDFLNRSQDLEPNIGLGSSINDFTKNLNFFWTRYLAILISS